MSEVEQFIRAQAEVVMAARQNLADIERKAPERVEAHIRRIINCGIHEVDESVDVATAIQLGSEVVNAYDTVRPTWAKLASDLTASRSSDHFLWYENAERDEGYNDGGWHPVMKRYDIMAVGVLEGQLPFSFERADEVGGKLDVRLNTMEGKYVHAAVDKDGRYRQPQISIPPSLTLLGINSEKTMLAPERGVYNVKESLVTHDYDGIIEVFSREGMAHAYLAYRGLCRMIGAEPVAPPTPESAALLEHHKLLLLDQAMDERGQAEQYTRHLAEAERLEAEAANL